MKRPAIFFDRDNTLIICDGYLGDVNAVHLISGAADSVARVRRLGYATVVVSNQSGVARGLFPEETVYAINAKLDQVLTDANPSAVIDRHEFCPFHPDAVVERYREDSDLRKPKPGMIIRAAKQLALDLSRSWLIGDTARDIEAGAAAGCRTILFKPPGIPASPESARPARITPNYVCTSLSEAVDYIERNPEPPALPEPTEPDRIPATPPGIDTRKLELLADQILQEMRKSREHPHHDFSVSKLLAGVVQVLAVSVLVYSYFEVPDRQMLLLLSIALQTLTISLLVMGRQK